MVFLLRASAAMRSLRQCARHGSCSIAFGPKLAWISRNITLRFSTAITEILEIIMSDIMRPVPFEGLLQRIFDEFR
ncbi:MAG: hypothetical protein KBF66_18955, partial [Rhodoferax sp.]|uniref:hypothetical protein n=1 Tax=Rhodoferax sp. TaxID=50421 RepID=UPI001B4557A1